MSTEEAPPTGIPVLIWSGGACAVAIFVEGSDEDGPWRVFMNRGSDEILQ